MDADLRRKQIITMITEKKSPLSASSIAKTLNVSRQVVVGNIALLRAQGNEIIATARGYIVPMFKETGQYLDKMACKHTPENTVDELYMEAFNA